MSSETSMNLANEITASTKLYGFIAEKAQSNRFSVVLNKRFKSGNDDAMIIPMNIREDDLYFTVSGLRSSHLKGVAIAEEYRHAVLELLENKSDEVIACGFCDILHIRDQKLYGGVMVGHAIALALKAAQVEHLAIIGSGALATSVLKHLNESDVKKVTLYNDRVESCLSCFERAGTLEGIDTDIERLILDQPCDLSHCDAVLNASLLQAPNAIALTPAPLMMDLAISPSLFSASGAKEYQGYDALLPYLTEAAYTYWREV
jgi:shikimate 5-dehydrogenase